MVGYRARGLVRDRTGSVHRLLGGPACREQRARRDEEEHG
jgi:hypothetical protein